MRIHALEITGFGPFKGTEKIDFDALTADHLFMLEGPTGAGKSSIIDAIVWVLYGQTAHQAAKKVNDDKEVKEFAARIHSDFIEPGDETRVVMEFSVNAARYRVQRTLAFKPKTKASPELKAATTSRLEFIKPTAEAITKDIHFEIYRILQMEVTQFSQLVVLPQAAFDTFLRAKSEARGEVLEKIFKTNFYTDLENYLQNRGREIKAEFEAQKLEVDRHIMNLAGIAAGDPDTEIDSTESKKVFRESDETTPRSMKDDLLERFYLDLLPDVEEDQSKHDELELAKQPFSAEVVTLDSSLERISDKAKRVKRLAVLEGENDKFTELEGQLKQLGKAKNLRVYQEALEAAEEVIDELDEIDEDLEGWTSIEVKDRLKEIAPQVKALAAEVAKNEGLGEKVELLESQLEAAEEAAEAIIEIPKVEKKIETLDGKIVAQKKKINDYEKKRAASWVQDAAKSLKKGQSCPVCGSKEHPAPVKGAGSFDEAILQKYQEELESFGEQRTDLKSDLAQYKASAKKKGKSVTTIKSEISAAAKKLAKQDKTEEEHSLLEDEQTLLTENQQLIADHEAANVALEKAEKKFNDELTKAGLSRVDLGKLLRIDEEKITASIKAYRDEITEIKALLNQPEIKALPAELELKTKRAELIQKIALIDADLVVVNKRLALAVDRTKRLDEIKDGITAALDQIDAITIKYGPVLELNTLANGFNKDALSLKNFVLQERLEMILERASLNLLKISNGKFEFKLNEEKSGQQKKTAGLGITVIDHVAGKERPAEALSGGETFYASLSLCLGLAEVVKMDKGGIELGTLFIDEGFGSLSNDKLVEVLDVLDKLRENGRIIGIVTHLEDMKTQIPLRLEVFRTDDGSSKTRMAVGGMI